MDKETIKKLIADAFTPTGYSPNEEEIKKINNLAEGVTNALVAYVNAELLNLSKNLNSQNAYIVNSTYSDTGAISNVNLMPSEITNYKPLVSTE